MKKVSLSTYTTNNRMDEYNRIMSELARFYSLPFLSLVYYLYNELGYTQERIAEIVNARLPKGQTVSRQAIKYALDQAGLLNK